MLRSSRRGLETITAEIVGNLDPLLECWTTNGKQPNPEVAAFVLNEIKTFRDAAPKHFKRRAIRETRGTAQGIINAIDRLERQMRDASPEMELRLRYYRTDLSTALDQVRRECRSAIQSSHIGGKKDHVKEWVAKVAATLIRRFSAEVPDSGSSDSPLRKIAGLAYEAVTETQDIDLKRACDAELRPTESSRR